VISIIISHLAAGYRTTKRYALSSHGPLKLTTDRHEASRGLIATAELLDSRVDGRYV